MLLLSSFVLLFPLALADCPCSAGTCSCSNLVSYATCIFNDHPFECDTVFVSCSDFVNIESTACTELSLSCSGSELRCEAPAPPFYPGDDSECSGRCILGMQWYLFALICCGAFLLLTFLFKLIKLIRQDIRRLSECLAECLRKCGLRQRESTLQTTITDAERLLSRLEEQQNSTPAALPVNVVRDHNNKYQPAPGFTWANTTPGDLTVVKKQEYTGPWKAGVRVACHAKMGKDSTKSEAKLFGVIDAPPDRDNEVKIRFDGGQIGCSKTVVQFIPVAWVQTEEQVKKTDMRFKYAVGKRVACHYKTNADVRSAKPELGYVESAPQKEGHINICFEFNGGKHVQTVPVGWVVSDADAYLRANPPQAKASQQDHYDILGLKPGASAEAIQRAYKDLCRQYHPDKTAKKETVQSATTSHFKKIQAAYQCLADSTSRAKFDKSMGFSEAGPPSPKFNKAALVEIHGLKTASQYNGRQGEVTDYLPGKQRYVVGFLFKGEHKVIEVAEANLRLEAV